MKSIHHLAVPSLPIWLLSVLIGWPGGAAGQQESPSTPDDGNSPATAVQEPTVEEKSLLAVRNLLDAIGDAERELKDLKRRLAAALSEAEREELNEALQAKTLQFEELTNDLSTVATGIDPGAYDREIGETGTLSSELEELLRPIVGQMKELTEKPREMEDLRAKVSHHRQQIEKANDALSNLDLLLTAATDETVLDTLGSLRVLWVERLETAENDLNVSELKLEEAQRRQNSLFVSLREGMASFFRMRGRNFLTAIVAFLGIWLGIRLSYRLVTRLIPPVRKNGRSFFARLARICVEAVALLAGIGAAILVLYSASDWVLLGLLLIFLGGLIWTGRRALPHLYEQIKLLLNLGSVREGERVVVEGIPWIVKRINIYTDLVNPMLLGGRLRVPMSILTTLHSRPYDADEAWFPTAVGDWVELSDGTFGELVRQTPHWVTVLELGGAKKGFKMMEFLSLSPRVLTNDFRVRSIFGIDYGHQAIATTEIPRILQDRVSSELAEIVAPDEILMVDVLFKEAGASSLDYVVVADFAGSAAAKRNLLECAIQRICVDVCNEKDWVIPFTQITLHQAPVKAAG